MPRSRQISNDKTFSSRFGISDAFWALFMGACITLGIVAVVHDVAEYRWKQRAISEFDARVPKMMGEAPYNPATGKRLIGEATGCLITLITVHVAVRGIRRRRRYGGVINASVKWISAPQPRTTPARAVRLPDIPVARTGRLPSSVKKSGSLAADRLSVVLWNDHVARVEKELA